MIRVTRLNGKTFYVNAELIQFVERTADTVITLTTGVKVVVSDAPEAVVEAIVEYRRRAYADRVATGG